MSNTSSRKIRSTDTAETSDTRQKCHIHDKVEKTWIDDIREKVCVSENEHRLKEFEGKHYCLFHLPKKNKREADKFNKIFNARLDKIDEKCAEIEAEFPDDEKKQLQVKREKNRNYDFRYLWFPTKINLNKRRFASDADFNSASFSASAYFSEASFSAVAYFRSASFSAFADFSSASFSAYADFSSASFSAVAYFSEASFSAVAYFSEASFSASAYFSEASFSAVAYFSEASFSASAYFSEASFSADADFSSAIFEEKSQIYFWDTRFCSTVSFNKTEISAFVEFDGDIFLDEEAVKEFKRELEKKGVENNIEIGQESILDLRQVRLFNPERVSFNSMEKLRPSWFVNVDDARRIAFNDIEWLNLEIDLNRNGLDAELESLEERKINRAEVSYTKTCNQLADNAEANRRFREAEKFRKQGIVLNNEKNDVHCHIHDAVHPEDKAEIRKDVCKEYPVVNEAGGKFYCLLHNPDKNKAEIFLEEFNQIKRTCTDFRSVVFPITVNYGEDMPDEINFTGATFLRNVVFNKATFEKLNFTNSFFKEESELVFQDSTCKKHIKLDKADIDGKLFIKGETFQSRDSDFSIKDARIEKSHWINFHSVTLLPHYFQDIDPSEFIFKDCKWIREDRSEFDVKNEITKTSHKDIAQICNQIANNYENNRDYDESSKFRYASMESKRLGFNDNHHRITRPFNLYSWYKWTSGYGESRLWTGGILIFTLVLFAFLYAMPIGEFNYKNNPRQAAKSSIESFCESGWLQINNNSPRMNACESVAHSLAVASFQRPEPKPKNAIAKLLVTFQTIITPILAGLLALAIRRKFKR